MDKCIFVDGSLKFVNNQNVSKEDVINNMFQEGYEELFKYYSKDLFDKFLEVCMLNTNWNFHTPKINAPILYLSTSEEYKDDLDKISDNYEFVLIDSTHEFIIRKDVDKIVKYFKL